MSTPSSTKLTASTPRVPGLDNARQSAKCLGIVRAMRDSTEMIMSFSRRAVLIAVAVTAITILSAAATHAETAGSIRVAQAQQNERERVFRFLFKRGETRTAPQRSQKTRRTLKRNSVRQRGAPEAPTEQAARAEKVEGANTVLVIGDFMGSALGRGLDAAYSGDASIRIVNLSDGASGLVRNDYLDWPERLAEAIEKESPAAVVIMIGANDRQPFLTEKIPFDTGEGAWSALYAERIAELAKVVTDSGVPGIWAGLVPVRSPSLSRDYSTFNSRYREILATTPITYVDLWNGFADDNGRYAAVGPDVNGQIRQLRLKDGLNFARAGRRKLAFFIEPELQRALEGAAPALATVAPSGSAVAASPSEKSRQEIGPMAPINALPPGGGDALVTLDAPSAPAPLASAFDEPPPAGRADVYPWPGQVQ